MKKVDVFSLSIALILNLIIVLLMSSLSQKEVEGKIKVGLVSMNDSVSANYEGFKDTKGEEPVEPPSKKEPQPIENQPEIKKGLTLEDRLKDIQITAPKMDTPSKTGIPVKKSDISQQKQTASTKTTEAAIKTLGKIDGIPSGYKLGSIDGDIDSKWDPNNKEPEYPESAQIKGIGGTVRLRLTIDEQGNVRNIVFNKGTGVPEIDLAIEKVARTWKIKLTKKGKTVYGDVLLEYDFKLVGN